MISIKMVYLRNEGIWLEIGGSTPWVKINDYGRIKNILISSSTVILQLKGLEIEIPKEQCWLGYEVAYNANDVEGD